MSSSLFRKSKASRPRSRLAASFALRGAGAAGFLLAALLASSAAASAADDAAQTAQRILQAAGMTGGLVVHLNCGDGRLTAALSAGPAFLVHGLARAQQDVDRARRAIQAAGAYGPASVARWTSGRLPYVNDLANLIVVSPGPGRVADAELLRVLRPGGAAVFLDGGRIRHTLRKPWPKDIDEWTHYLHDADNNAVAHDRRVGPPRHLQWVGGPRWSRHHDRVSSLSALVSAGGRVFYIFDEGCTASILLPSHRALIARDAFNGVVLWKRPVADWETRFWPLKSGPAQLPRRLVAMRDTVFVTLGINAPVTALDAATGRTRRVYKQTKGTVEILYSKGALFLLVEPRLNERKYRDPRAVREPWWKGEPAVVMAVDAESGETRWRFESPVAPLTLAADGEQVFFNDGRRVVCLDQRTGGLKWKSEPLPIVKRIMSFFAPTLVVRDGVVLFAGGEESGLVKSTGGAVKSDTITALDAATGRKLWSAKHPPSGYSSPEDVFVIDGAVWFEGVSNGALPGQVVGIDLRSGKVRASYPKADIKTYWFHHRCYRGKATDRFLMVSRTGIEFINPKTGHWQIHDWIRGGCMYGVMPANGLLYTPQHPCACYLESKLFGLNAVAADTPDRRVALPPPGTPRLERGPAYGKVAAATKPSAGDWPTYRHDAARSGRASTRVSVKLARRWRTRLPGRLTSPVVSNGKVWLASIDAHTLYALDAATGEIVAQFTAGGRIDSPPTLWRGLALFGCADGYVYCLRASDAALVWRFRAAPLDRRLFSFGQLESVWPVHGSVLVEQGVAYAVAGRSMFLDGGMRLCRLDPATGRLVGETALDDRDPLTGKPLQSDVKRLNMPVALPDVLSSDGQHVFMRGQCFELDGRRLSVAPPAADPIEQGAAQHGGPRHLFSPTGFLDGSWFHRSYWMYGRTFSSGWNGYYVSGKFAPAGRILAFNDSKIFGYGREPRYYRWTTPLECRLFRADKEPPKVDLAALRRGGAGSMIRIPNSKSLNAAGKPVVVEAWILAERPDGVVLARGGPIHGYALYLKRGKPCFALRRNRDLFIAAGKQRVLGRWTHLAGALTPDHQLQLYVNGELAATASAPGLLTSDPQQATAIGADDRGAAGDYRSPFGFTGLIDEVREFFGAVTPQELRAHMAAGGVPAAGRAALVLCYSFDRGQAKDESGRGNDGKLQRCRFVKGKFGLAAKFVGARSPRRSHWVNYDWTQRVPLLARGMTLTPDALFIAGPPDLVDEAQAFRRLNDPAVQAKLRAQEAAWRGEKGGLLWAVSLDDGAKKAEWKLASPPVWDGMAAAAGRLYLACMNGSVVCFGPSSTSAKER